MEKIADAEVIGLIRKMCKQQEESIEQFKQGGRQDLVDKELFELNVLKGYLPAELPEADVTKAVTEAIAATGASGIKEMGKVMKEVMAKIGGKADGKVISRIVKEKLS